MRKTSLKVASSPKKNWAGGSPIKLTKTDQGKKDSAEKTQNSDSFEQIPKKLTYSGALQHGRGRGGRGGRGRGGRGQRKLATVRLAETPVDDIQQAFNRKAAEAHDSAENGTGDPKDDRFLEDSVEDPPASFLQQASLSEQPIAEEDETLEEDDFPEVTFVGNVEEISDAPNKLSDDSPVAMDVEGDKTNNTERPQVPAGAPPVEETTVFGTADMPDASDVSTGAVPTELSVVMLKTPTAEIVKQITNRNIANKKWRPIIRNPPKALTKHKRLYDTRIDLKIGFAASKTRPLENFLEVFKALVDELKSVDDRIVIRPYLEDNSAHRCIKNADDIPVLLSELRIFLTDLFISDKGRDAHPAMFISHDMPFSDIRVNLQTWMNTHRCGMYDRPLQVEKIKSIGWLLFSHRFTDRDSIQEAILAQTGVPVGARWKMITAGTTNGPIKEEDKIKAMHLYVDARSYTHDKEKVKLAFHSATAEYPHGMEFKLIPELKDVNNSRSRGKIDGYRNKQKGWSENLIKIPTAELVDIDAKINADESNSTLRDLLMKMTAPSGKQLFVSVDRSFSQPEFNFVVAPQHNADAWARISGLLPYLEAHIPPKYHHGLRKFFTDSAIYRSADLRFDLETGEVVGIEDDYVDELDDLLAKDKDHMNFDPQAGLDDTEEAEPKGDDDSSASEEVKAFDMGDDTSTIATKAATVKSKAASVAKASIQIQDVPTQKNTGKKKSTKKKKGQPKKDDSSSSEDEMSVMSTKVDTLTEQVSQLTTLVQKLAEGMQPPSKARKPSGGASGSANSSNNGHKTSGGTKAPSGKTLASGSSGS